MSRVLKNQSGINKTRILNKVVSKYSADNDLSTSEESSIEKKYLETKFRDELDLIKKEAYEKAYSETEQALRDELENSYQELVSGLNEEFKHKSGELDHKIKTLSSIIMSISGQYDDLSASQESIAIFLTLEALYKLLGDKATYQAAIAKSIAEQITEFTRNNELKVRISSKDLDLENILPKNLIKKIKIVKDPLLSPGQCEIEDGFSLIDVGVITQLDLMRESLINRFSELNDESR